MSATSRDLVDQLQRLLNWRSRASVALKAFLASALVCGTLWTVLTFVPFLDGPALHALLAVPFAVLALVWWRSGGADPVPLADRRLHLRDAFRTWRVRTLPPAWQACLRDQLDRQLRGQDLRRALPRQRIGRARHLLFPLLLLLFLRFGLPDFIGSRGDGGIGGRAAAGTGPGDGQGGDQPGPGDGDGMPQQAPPQKAGGGGGARPPAPPPDEAPAKPAGPLPQAERHVDAFVPPAFDRDGPRTEREVAAAERPVGGQSPPPGAAGAGGGAAGTEALPDLRPAVEEAIQRRRIDPAEAAFMRRYFAELRRERR